MTYLTSIADLLAVLLLLATIRAIRDHRKRKGLPYPPGPRPLPIIGNLFDIPKEFSWLTYTQFSKTYGSILSLHVFGQVIVVLNSAKAAKDLLERRAGIYSDCPPIPFIEMMGWHWLVPAARSDDRWREARRLLDRSLRPGAIALYRPMQQTRAHALLSRLLANPHQWQAHIELFQGELILAMTYGYELRHREDSMIDAVKRVTNFVTTKLLPGALLVNQIPILRYIPEWLPWFSYWPLARFGSDLGKQALYPPIQFVKESILNGTAQSSLALDSLQELENLKLVGSDRDKAEETIVGALGSIYFGQYPTTVSSLMSFLVAMLLYPGVQKKAQDELDSVIGWEWLPTFEDRPMLPFIDVVCKETLRWRPAVSAAVPHATTEDDVYEGSFIPKGVALATASTVFRAIMHDPELYPEPDIFKPERFLNPDGSPRDDLNLTSVFGFGKRICPGRHFVDATLFIVVASLFSVFNFERGKGDGGEPSDYTYTGGLVSAPNPFPCSFIPRGKRARDLILSDSMAR
ncbi:cytochrome P450 [Russula brevipes]|nr:cytochrome P450 [Russula brevipes]